MFVCELKAVQTFLSGNNFYLGENTHSSILMFLFPSCNTKPACINFGPHHAKAPVTNATQVKPSVENMNDGFLEISVDKKHKIGMLNRNILSTKMIKIGEIQNITF